MPRKWFRVHGSWFIVKNIFNSLKGSPRYRFGEAGAVAPILVVLLLLGGLGVGLFLINKPTNLTPKAASKNLVFLADDGKTQIKKTQNSQVKLKITAPWPAANLNMPDQSKPEADGSKSEQVEIKGRIFDKVTNAPIVQIKGPGIPIEPLFYFIGSLNGKNQGIPVIIDDRGEFSFKLNKGTYFHIGSLNNRSKIFGEYHEYPVLTNARNNNESGYFFQQAGYDCSVIDPKLEDVCGPYLVKTQDLPDDISFDFAFVPINSGPAPTPSFGWGIPPKNKGKKNLTTAHVLLAEDANFKQNVQIMDYTSNSMVVTYDFPKSIAGSIEPGTKNIFAKFIATDGTQQKAVPFPAIIQYQPN